MDILNEKRFYFINPQDKAFIAAFDKKWNSSDIPSETPSAAAIVGADTCSLTENPAPSRLTSMRGSILLIAVWR